MTLKIFISSWNFSFQHKRSEFQPHIWWLHQILRHSFSAWPNSKIFIVTKLNFLRTRIFTHQSKILNVQKGDLQSYWSTDLLLHTLNFGQIMFLDRYFHILRFIFKDLKDSTHVFLRDHAKKALERPYTGPHKILNRTSDRVNYP